MSETMSREKFKNGLRGFQDRIERAQAEGDGRTADNIYAEQQRWVAGVKGNNTIVGGRDSTSPHGSRGA